jgi:transposase-like protein
MIDTGRPEEMSKKRRNFSAQFKLETVLDGLRGEKTVAQICRERDITESLYYKWRDAFMERAADIFADQRGPQRDEQAERIAALERLAGKQALEIEILKKAGSLLGSMRERNGR